MRCSRRTALLQLACATGLAPIAMAADGTAIFDLPPEPIRRKDRDPFTMTRDRWRVAMASPDQPYSYAEGPSAQRFELRAGDVCRSIDGSRAGQKGCPERCMVVWADHRPFFEPTHFGFDFMVEMEGPNTNPWTLLAQYHNHADLIAPGIFEPWCSPPVAVMLAPDPKRNGNSIMTISGRFEADKITTVCPSEMILGAVPFRFGVPHRLDIVFVNGKGGPGSVRAVFDGSVIADYHGPIGFNDDRGCYFSFGAYRSPTHAPAQNIVTHFSKVSEGPGVS